MRISLIFIGRAEALAQQYEGVLTTSFVVRDPGSNAQALEVPNIGDRVSLGMHPGLDRRTFRCTARHWDFCAAGGPALVIELDMA